MKSILQSALLFACVTKMKNMDERTREIIKSYIYTFWLLKFSGARPGEKLDTHKVLYELWMLTIQTFRETGTWSSQHSLVAETFLKESLYTSLNSVERFSQITTVPMDLAETNKTIDAVFQERTHHFGNILTWELSCFGDAEMVQP